MRDEVLMSVTRVVDDSTGIWDVDEVEFSICSYALEKFLLRTGEKGNEEIRMTLKDLADRLDDYMPKHDEEAAHD